MFALKVTALFLLLTKFAASQVSDTQELRQKPPPLLIWHGLGDAYDADGLISVAELAEKVNEGTYVYNVRLDNSTSGDRRATFFGNVTQQLESVCADLASHPIIGTAKEVNAMGFSQGGQFLRAYVERCNKPPVKNLVTFGSQHNGISKFQGCASTDWLCKGAEALLAGNIWSNFAQSGLVPAQYFRNPEDLESYLEHSNFLADVNNERKLKNEKYKENIASLTKFVMFVFDEDVTVHPKESGWFAEVNATSEVVTDLRERLLYKEDWLGLKKLDKKGGLVFKLTPGAHMRLSEKVLNETFKEYFSAALATNDSPPSMVGLGLQNVFGADRDP